MFLPFYFLQLVIINFQITLLLKIGEVLIPLSEDNFLKSCFSIFTLQYDISISNHSYRVMESRT